MGEVLILIFGIRHYHKIAFICVLILEKFAFIRIQITKFFIFQDISVQRKTHVVDMGNASKMAGVCVDLVGLLRKIVQVVL